MNRLNISSIISLPLICLFIIVSFSNSFGQLSITSAGTPYTIDFDNTVSGVNNGTFIASGFQSSPSGGQIDSDGIIVTGLSDGNMSFGGTYTAGDYTRGSSIGGVTLGGIYAFDVGSGNYTLGFQPVGPTNSDMTPGDIILKIQNNTGGDASTFLIQYSLFYLNDQDRANSFSIAYSTDNITYSSYSQTFNTPELADISPTWQSVPRSLSIDLSSTPIPDGEFIYIKWHTNDYLGLGSRDEISLDNIMVTVNPSIENSSLVLNYSGAQPNPVTITSTANTSGDALEVLYLRIQDLGSGDILPTIVQSIRVIPGSNNNISWTSQIQGVLFYDGISLINTQSVDINDAYIDITFQNGDVMINNGSIRSFAILIYLNSSGITDGATLQFQVDTDTNGFSTYPSGSGFASSFPASFSSNDIEIDVAASELRFVNQPVDANTNLAMAIDIAVEATDAFGNRDLDFVGSIDLSSSGTINPVAAQAAVSGLATWLESTDPIIHTAAGTGLTLTASSGSLNGVSNTFDIIQGADRVEFTSYPAQGQRNQVVAPIIVSALKPDLTVDDTYTGDITLSFNTGPGGISGTLVKTAVAGIATFNDIIFDTDGDYTLLAEGDVYMTDATSGTIQIGTFFQGFTTCPAPGWLSVIISGNGWSCGSGYASVNGIGGSSPTEAWYIAPSIDFSALTNQVLSFDSWTSGTDVSHPRLEVLYSENYSGSGNPNLPGVIWSSLTFSPPTENSQVWSSSGLIDLTVLSGNAYVAFKYTSSGTAAGSSTEWRIDNVSITQNGCSAPSIQPTNLAFSNILQDEMTLTWDNGNGTGRLVLATQGTTVAELPSQGTPPYTADPVFGNGTQIGNSYVVYQGTGNSVSVTSLLQNTEYAFAIFEYNCDAASPVFNEANPAAGSQLTVDPNASDVIVDAGYTYPTDIAYGSYPDPALTMNLGNSIGVFGLTLRDGGASASSDGLPTNLTSITISTNGSQAIRAAGIYDGTNLIDPTNVNGSTEFTIDLSGNPITATDQNTFNFELRVTFMQGDFIIDNDQLLFTVIGVVADPTGTQFSLPDGGAAESAATGSENVIIVDAITLEFVQVPTSTILVNSAFTIEVEALDADGSRDRDVTLDLSKIAGSGILSSISGLQQTTGTGTALWNDLIYDTEESGVQFQVADNAAVLTSITTALLSAKNGLSVFTFTGASGAESSYSPDNQPVNLTVSDISRGSNLAAETFANAFNARSWSQISGPEDEYFYEFTVTANTGFDFNLNSIEIDHRRSGDGPVLWVVRSSLDGYATDIDQVFSTPAVDTWYTNQEVNFGTTVQNETSVTLRLYAYNASGGSGTWTIDNLAIYGTTSDIQAPSFNAGYPSADSTKTDGFHLYVNIDEPATAYYQILSAPSSTPSLIDFIANADGSIVVSTSDSTYREIISGLTIASGYDVYFLLDDGTNQSVIDETLKNVRTSDNTSNVTAPSTPIGNQLISSIADTPAEAVDVFSFDINDYNTFPTNDIAPTVVTNIQIGQLGATDLRTFIAGVTLKDGLDNPIPIASQTINQNTIDISIDPSALVVLDGLSETITLGVYLQSDGLVDNESFNFYLSGNVFSSSNYFSQFATPAVAGFILSGTHSVNVVADRLNIISYTTDIPNANQDIDLDVEAVDANGNRDLDENTDVTIVLGQSINGGTVSVQGAPPDITQSLSSGFATWDNIRYIPNNDYITLITSSGTLIDDTTGIIEIGNPNDLIVTSNLTLSADLIVNSVDIQSTGNLTINPGVTLFVAENFNVDGILNGQSGTVDFNAGGNSLQEITGTTNPVNFYNITVTNSGNSGVLSEVNINLRNTLLLTDNAIFDADGIANDKNFTLISTSSNTARIGPMGIDARLDGEIVWERSLRSGPVGWRYIGTPIKGQTLGSISDDVNIQGIAESYPNAWTNIGTYNEPAGTEGEEGFDGWVDFTSNGNPLDASGKKRGMKLWLWSSAYQPAAKIINKGLPVIGDGSDNIAGSGETYNFNTSFTPSSFGGGGWNFYANPYPCELDWELVLQSDLNGEAVHIWNPSTQQYGTYSAATNQGTNGVSQYVASGQGFFIKANSGSATLSVAESSKSTANGNSFLRVADEEFPSIMINISSDDGKTDETAIAFTGFASDGYDPLFDAEKLAGGWVNISSKIGDELLAINAMGNTRGVQSIKLNIDPYSFGNYSFGFSAFEGFDDEAVVTLKDKLLNKSTVINTNATYNFVIDQNNTATYGADRFELQLLSPLKFSFEDVQAKAGQEFVVPVHADNVADIISTQMALDWDSEAISFISIEETGDADITDFDLTEVENGKLSFTNLNGSPLDLPDGTKLFAIRFKALNGQPQAQIRFEEQSMSIKAINDIEMPFNTKDLLFEILQNKFIAGTVTTHSGDPIDNVVIRAEGDENVENSTDLVGLYSLDTYEQSNYMLSASKVDNFPLNEVVTSLDIIKARRHILNIEAFESPYQWIAADVNASNSISALDLVEMRKVVLGIQESFQGGLDWLFIPGVYDLSEDPFSYQTNVDVSLIDQHINMDFKGVKIGDVDNSWITHGGARKSKSNLEISLKNLKLEDGIVEIPLVAKDFNDISGYQFSITWDPNQLEYYGLEHQVLEGHFNEQMVNQGILTTMWDENSGKSIDLENGSVLFMLKFTARNEDAISAVELNSTLTEAVAFDGKLNVMAINSTAAIVNLEELRNGRLELLQNVPNPFDFSTSISFNLPKPGKARLSIINLLGEIIYLHEKEYSPGVYTISWNKNQTTRTLAPGVYLYRLESNGEEVVKKMVIE